MRKATAFGLELMAMMSRSILLALAIMVQVAPADDRHNVKLTYQKRENVQGQTVDVFTVGKDRHILFGLAPTRPTAATFSRRYSDLPEV